MRKIKFETPWIYLGDLFWNHPVLTAQVVGEGAEARPVWFPPVLCSN